MQQSCFLEGKNRGRCYLPCKEVLDDEEKGSTVENGYLMRAGRLLTKLNKSHLFS
jgi:hypothetical protein